MTEMIRCHACGTPRPKGVMCYFHIENNLTVRPFCDDQCAAAFAPDMAGLLQEAPLEMITLGLYDVQPVPADLPKVSTPVEYQSEIPSDRLSELLQQAIEMNVQRLMAKPVSFRLADKRKAEFIYLLGSQRFNSLSAAINYCIQFTKDHGGMDK